MPDGIVIRQATSADRASISELWWEMMIFHRARDPQFFRLKPKAETLAIWLKYLDESLVDERQCVVVADDGVQLAGFANGKPADDPPTFSSPAYGFITNFVISERYRRRGLGRRLYQAIAEHFRTLGISEIRLTATVSNPVSMAFWKELGFEPFIVTMRKLM